jgi:hypothetical protein
MVPAQLIKLTRLMERTTGDAGIGIGLIDGPVSIQHPDLNAQHLREIAGSNRASCTQGGSVACLHGTFIAGILSAKRTSLAPSICPDCTLFIRLIFNTDFTEKFFVRVDATEEFPFLVTKMSPYYDR